MGPDRGQARYRLLSRIAVGGMAEIFLATLQGEAGFEREVIIKKILPGYADELEFAKRLVDEGLLAGKLHHSNIVQVLDLGRLGPDYFIAMEYVDGPDLRDVLARAVAKGFLLPVPIAVHILREVARALAYAHDKKDEGGKSLNIIHRDISPANVLISWEGAVKLGDFGIAKASQRLVHTLTGVLQGKFPYMSPEQAGGGECDQRSDVFSFGATAYELLTLVRPFQAESDLKTLERVKCAQHPPLLKHRDNLPSELVEVVHTCLARDRDQRFANGAQLERALATLMQKCGWVVTEGDVADMLAALYGDDRVSRLAEARSSPEPLAVVTASPLDGRVLVPDAPRHKSSVNVTAQESPRTRSVVAPTWKLRAQRQRRTWVLWTALMVVLALALAADFRFFHVFLGRSEPEPVPPVLPEPAAVEPAPPGRREAAA